MRDALVKAGARPERQLPEWRKAPLRLREIHNGVSPCIGH